MTSATPTKAPEITEDGHCRSCKYWTGRDRPVRKDLPIGECRRYAPRDVFPRTKDEDWCGDYLSFRYLSHPGQLFAS